MPMAIQQATALPADDDGNTDTPAHNDGHAVSFDIDAKTGQITVSARAMLDADGTDGQGRVQPIHTTSLSGPLTETAIPRTSTWQFTYWSITNLP